MTFLEVAKKWATMIFDIFDDFYDLIMSYDFTAFAFWAVVTCGVLLLFANLIIPPVTVVQDTLKAERGMSAANRGFDRMFSREHKRQERMIREVEKEKKRNRAQYAQMLLNTRDYSQSRFVTIEGKHYYRKGLVSFGEKMKSSDRDYSYDLEDIKKSKKGDKT